MRGPRGTMESKQIHGNPPPRCAGELPDQWSICNNRTKGQSAWMGRRRLSQDRTGKGGVLLGREGQGEEQQDSRVLTEGADILEKSPRSELVRCVDLLGQEHCREGRP